MEKYNDIPDEQGLMMAELLSLKENNSQVVAFSYSDSETNYPEKILNLSCSLVGNWKIFDFNYHEKEEEPYKKFLELMKCETEGKTTNGLLSHYFWVQKIKLDVRCKSLDSGTIELWKKVTKLADVNPSASQIWKWYQDFYQSPYILIREEEINGSKWYTSFVYSPEKHSFVKLSLSKHDECYKMYAHKYYQKELPATAE